MSSSIGTMGAARPAGPPQGAPTRTLAETLGPRQTNGPRPGPNAQRMAPAMVAPEATMPQIGVGFGNLQSWEFTQRVARGLSLSTLVPEAYRAFTKRGRGDNAQMVPNDSALPNCIVALNMANRLGADPLMVMQNLYIVEGRPSWSSQFIISAINSCGRFSAMKFRIEREDQPREVEWTAFEWSNGQRQEKRYRATVRNATCVAYATEKLTSEVLESPQVSIEMAVQEGWWGKNGSKWKTMPELMLRYRAASFFGRLYAPEILMGLKTEEETREIIDAEQDLDGTWQAPQGDDEMVPVVDAEPQTAAPEPGGSADDAQDSSLASAAPQAEASADVRMADDPDMAARLPEVRAALEGCPDWTVVSVSNGGVTWWCWRAASGNIDGRRDEAAAKEACAAAYQDARDAESGGPALPLKGGGARGGK